MKLLARLVGCAAALLAVCTVLADETARPPEQPDLVRIKVKRVSDAYLLPGTDFRSYTKVLIDPADVSFHKDWMRNVNRQPGTRRVDEKDAQAIADAARSGFSEIWEEAFRKAGYEIATAPGAEVLRLSPVIANLYINAPDTMTAGRSRTYTVDAGEATLVLHARDSETGATLGLAVDRRRAGGSGRQLTWTTSVSNRSDFGALFRQWAEISVKGLQDLKDKSPLPMQLREAKGN